MPRCSILSATERKSLLVLPGNHADLIRYYPLSESDLSSDSDDLFPDY